MSGHMIYMAPGLPMDRYSAYMQVVKQELNKKEKTIKEDLVVIVRPHGMFPKLEFKLRHQVSEEDEVRILDELLNTDLKVYNKKLDAERKKIRDTVGTYKPA